jgi:hypothetical protein
MADRRREEYFADFKVPYSIEDPTTGISVSSGFRGYLKQRCRSLTIYYGSSYGSVSDF